MGAIRLFLAIGVFVAHFNDDVLDPLGMRAHQMWVLNFWAGRAVLFFYIISGFLMSYVLHQKYEATGRGTLAFYKSRFLRIYPLWWIVLIVAIALNYLKHQPLPETLLPAFVLLGSDWLVAFWHYPQSYWLHFPRAVEVGWTLGSELTFYLIAPIALRSNCIAVALLIGSAAVRIIAFATLNLNDGFYLIWTYFFFPATLVFFMLGHFGAVIYRRYDFTFRTSLLFLFASVALSCWQNPGGIDDWSAHLAAVCFALALPGIFEATKDNVYCNFCGDLTYPLYLTHSLTIGALFWPFSLFPWFSKYVPSAIAAYSGSKTTEAIFLTLTVLPIALLIAWVSHIGLENPSRRVTGAMLDLITRWLRPPTENQAASSRGNQI